MAFIAVADAWADIPLLQGLKNWQILWLPFLMLSLCLLVYSLCFRVHSVSWSVWYKLLLLTSSSQINYSTEVDDA